VFSGRWILKDLGGSVYSIKKYSFVRRGEKEDKSSKTNNPPGRYASGCRAIARPLCEKHKKGGGKFRMEKVKAPRGNNQLTTGGEGARKGEGGIIAIGPDRRVCSGQEYLR